MEWFAVGIVGYMGFLLIQFGLGMGINLFVAIPNHHSGANASNFVIGFILVLVGFLFTLPYGFAVTADLYGQFRQRTESAVAPAV